MALGTLPTVLALFAIAVVGFLLRSTNAASVFVAGHVVLPENDPDFHLHRILATLADFPHVPFYDRLIDYPYGGMIVWPPLFDLGVASLCRLAGFGPDDRAAVATLGALVVPALGALTCVPTYLLARRIVGRGFGLVAAAFVVLVPAHLWYSRVGFVDHHVAVTLIDVALLAIFLRATDAVTADPTTDRTRPLAWAAAGALAIAAGLATWNGFSMFVVVLDLFLAATIALATADERPRLALLVALSHGLAAILLLPLARATVAVSGAPLSPLLVSYLHVAILAGAAAAGALTWAIVQPRSARASAGRRDTAVRAATIGVSAVTLAAAAYAIAASPLAAGLVWLGARDPFMSAVQESVPMLRGADGGFDLGSASTWMTRLYLATPLLLGAVAWQLARVRGRDRGLLLLLVWGGSGFALSLAQRRFGETFAPALAILVAWGLSRAIPALAAALRDLGASSRLAALGAASAALLALAWAFAPYYRPLLASPERWTALARAAAGSGADEVLGRGSRDGQALAAAERLRDLIAVRTHPPADDTPTFGVMNTWPIGHRLLHVAGVGVASTPFGSYARPDAFDDWSSFFLATDEDAALAVLDRRQLRYVVVEDDLAPIGSAIVGRGENPRDYYGKEIAADGSVAYPARARFARTMFFRLTSLTGSEAALDEPDVGHSVVAGLEHLRLVIDSSPNADGGGVQVFERVAGAQLEIAGPSSHAGSLRLRFRSDTGRERLYTRSFALDASGHATLRVPYGTQRDDARDGAAYELCVGPDACTQVEVDENAVVAGEVVRVALVAG